MRKNFFNLGIDTELENLLNKNGIVEPTPIQAQTIPPLLTGKDVIAQAQTGTGKTFAFMLPIMQNIDVKKPFIQALIMTPTRELALQITNEAKKLISAKGINVLAAYGGQDVDKQIRKLKQDVHMVIGTPGRLLDHLRRRTIDFRQLKMLVLDEADQMLHMGFLQEVEEIIHQTSKNRQTMLFSATMPKEIHHLASQYMNKPIHIRVKSDKITLDEIKQLVIETTDRRKQAALFETLGKYNPFLAIIFCRTKRRASALNEALIEGGYASDELHGDLSQAKREKVMKAFRKAEIQLLVATDVAARGLDIEGVTHIFNYDIAQDAEAYIHRIGRTGRAGQTGVAITFVTPRDQHNLALIEKGINMKIERQKSDEEKREKSIKSTQDAREFREEKNKKNNKFKDRSPSKDKKFGKGKRTDNKKAFNSNKEKSAQDKKTTGRGSRSTSKNTRKAPR
ncbi:DEAD/DEAH box helicase [Clostridium formicaceticum]|uniref:DEAD-box ATP-dependent RNA helicase CshA n=1 Tax=Clostridium formicaceticum TaxID=1497 RepID=A0AAC9WH64_9CLOT|nr:DEAD/DEAH box helicase [Clostridium formicaceticum]AOY77979.1 DEAD/DEAH box helicase [Clostridium formicaceticum]ARE88603.1 DEAD-box ATP-dependent RNA helicase CshA [Clostridium formicaceticum]